MDWQQSVSLLIVAFAAVMLLRQKLRPQRFSFGSHAGCGCTAVAHTGPQTSIVFRARKGYRPEVRVKIR